MKVDNKTDVYSFGVVTLEVIMGRHPGELISCLLSSASSSSSSTSIVDHLLLNDMMDQRPSPPVNQVAEEVVLKNVNHNQDLMKDIKAYSKIKCELRKADLDWFHRKSFQCSSDVQRCPQFVKQKSPGFNWLSSLATPKRMCSEEFVRTVSSQSQRETEQNGIATLPFSLIYIYIYILHITHSQFGPLDLMDQ